MLAAIFGIILAIPLMGFVIAATGGLFLVMFICLVIIIIEILARNLIFDFLLTFLFGYIIPWFNVAVVSFLFYNPDILRQ